jgi:hypothetical protein
VHQNLIYTILAEAWVEGSKILSRSGATKVHVYNVIFRLLISIRCSFLRNSVFLMFNSWFYKDIRGFDLDLIQHSIPIKEGIKPIRKKQRPINLAMEATI